MVGGKIMTYSQLFREAASFAATLFALLPDNEPPLTAVFASRSATAFAGVLAVLMRGHGYVPLNRNFPPERTKIMLQRSGCKAMIVDTQSENQLDQILTGLDRKMLVAMFERETVDELSSRWPLHTFIGRRELLPPDHVAPGKACPNSMAYLLFTSGSTGSPKGVAVANRNVTHYVDFISAHFSISEEDRFSQTFDLTFDLSAADMFVAWEHGACVCCPSEKVLVNPGRFIIESRLTVWFSVPSTAVFMKRLGALKPGMYPLLRLTLFCGEALPAEVAKGWAEAAPNSIVENLYGPTELTIACMHYRWDSTRSPEEAEFGIVPIGEPFPAMLSLVVDESLNEVGIEEAGELLLTGPQLSVGYWRDPEKTAASFVTPPGRKEIYYRTGDRVRKTATGKPMVYLGRTDNQIKVLGHRVELGEVEAVVREETGVDAVLAVGWPKSKSGAGGIEVFLQSEILKDSDVKQRVANRLPSYMVPRRFHFLAEFPLNANGKYDRNALFNLLETIK